MISIRPARLEDVDAVLVDLCATDLAAVVAVGLEDWGNVRRGVLATMRNSVEAYTVERDGEVLAVGGVSFGEPPEGWLLSTSRVGMAKLAVSRMILWMADRHPGLRVFCHKDDPRANRWLSNLGFVMHQSSNPAFHGAVYAGRF